MGLFTAALSTMDGGDGSWRTPESFQDYATRNQLAVRGTAPHISIQGTTDLTSELRAAKVMVFRLGSPPGSKHTSFALAKSLDDWRDYFLFDSELFGHSPPELFQNPWQSDAVLPFGLLPKLSETSHVNLALASGLLDQALGVEAETTSIPATGRGTFTFTVRPHNKLAAAWTHYAGQVEIDSIFVGRRQGKKCLFVVEAKSSLSLGSLSKHKLVYPVLSIAVHVPGELSIVPVYMRVQETESRIRFNICECSMPDPRTQTTYINELEPISTVVMEIETPNF